LILVLLLKRQKISLPAHDKPEYSVVFKPPQVKQHEKAPVPLAYKKNSFSKIDTCIALCLGAMIKQNKNNI